MAFVLEKDKEYDLALKLYDRIRKRLPEEAQEALNIAMLNSINKNYDLAFSQYQDLRNNKKYTNYDLKKYLVNSMKCTVAKSVALRANPSVPEFFKSKISFSLRMVIEWSDPDAQFEVQFIDPKNNYSNWPHNPNDKELWLAEKESGYHSLEFLIENGPIGEWKFNMSLSEERENNPVYFKVILFKNFGTENEVIDIKTFSLRQPNLNQNIFKFFVN